MTVEAIEVRDGVPIPPVVRRSKYPFQTMEVGQSFFVFIGSNNANFVANANKRYAPKKFTQRMTVENGRRGIAVWRIS